MKARRIGLITNIASNAAVALSATTSQTPPASHNWQRRCSRAAPAARPFPWRCRACRCWWCAMGIRSEPTAPASPWQNGFSERLIGSIRRECVDNVIVLGEAHLLRILKNYADYYNRTRTHLSLEKDAPVSRAGDRPGAILCRPILGGLHHRYARI